MADLEKDQKYELHSMKEVIEDVDSGNLPASNDQVPGPIPFAAWLIIVSK